MSGGHRMRTSGSIPYSTMREVQCSIQASVYQELRLSSACGRSSGVIVLMHSRTEADSSFVMEGHVVDSSSCHLSQALWTSRHCFQSSVARSKLSWLSGAWHRASRASKRSGMQTMESQNVSRKLLRKPVHGFVHHCLELRKVLRRFSRLKQIFPCVSAQMRHATRPTYPDLAELQEHLMKRRMREYRGVHGTH